MRGQDHARSQVLGAYRRGCRDNGIEVDQMIVMLLILWSCHRDDWETWNLRKAVAPPASPEERHTHLVHAGPQRPPPDYRPEPQHVMRVAARMAEQIRIYHDHTWDFGNVDNRRSILGRAREVAAFEDVIIADLLGREIKP